MSTSRPFAYNPSLLTLPGTINVGSICIGVDPLNVYVANYGGLTWWNGPNEELGYVIAVPVPSNTQPTPYPGVFASVGFWGTAIFSSPFSDTTFVNLVNQVFNQSFTTGPAASSWLTTNGYWNSYPILSNTDAINYVSQVTSAGGYISFTTASALDVLFNDLQFYGLYNSLEGFYPMLGTSAATQGINGNGNTTYDIQFAGGWEFDSMGMKGNGINTYASIYKFYYANTTDLYNTHFSIYGTLAYNSPSNRGDLTLLYADDNNMGARIALNSLTTGDGIYEYTFNSSSPYPGKSNDFVVMSNDGNNTFKYQNGSPILSSSDSPYSIYDHIISLGLSKYSGTYQSSTNRYGWASFGLGMNPTEMGDYQTIVNTFMTSIGRNSY